MYTRRRINGILPDRQNHPQPQTGYERLVREHTRSEPGDVQLVDLDAQLVQRKALLALADAVARDVWIL